MARTDHETSSLGMQERQVSHLAGMLDEIDRRLVRLLETGGRLDDRLVHEVAALEVTRAAINRLLTQRKRAQKASSAR